MLQLDTQAVRNPIHEGKVAHYQCEIDYGSITPARMTQTRHVSFRTGPRLGSEFHGKVEQSVLSVGDGGGGVVFDDRLDQSVIVSDTAETLRVVLDS